MGEMLPLLPDDPEQVGGYVLCGRLGEGPRGVAYLGRPSPEAEASVVKLLHPRPSADAEARDRLLQELTEAKGLSGSHAVPPVEAGWLGDRPYVVRGYVKGASLQETVRADGPLEADALERLALGTLTALTAVHAAGLVHRGITPGNILIGADGPRVSDIGMGGSDDAYRAPEQVRGEPGDARSDLFSWAASIAYAATGTVPGGSARKDAPSGPDATEKPGASPAEGGPSADATVNLREAIAAAKAAAAKESAAKESAAEKPSPATPAGPDAPVSSEKPASDGSAGEDGPSAEATVNLREAIAAAKAAGAAGVPGPAAGSGGAPALDAVPQPLRRILLACLSPDPVARPTARNAMLRLLGEDDAAPAPSTDVMVAGAPMPGGPMAGVVLPAQQPFSGPNGGQRWGAPSMPGTVPPAHGPHQNGPHPNGPYQNGPHGNPMAGPGQVWQGLPPQRPAAPAWGAPPMPHQAPPGSPAGGPTLQNQGMPQRKGPSLALAASLAAVLALSVGGVWAAGHYTGTASFDNAAAEGTAKATDAAAAPADAIPSAETTGKRRQQPQTQVTVPWASTPDPDSTGVFPLTLPTDWVDETPAPTVTATLPNIPITPPAVPTWQPQSTWQPQATSAPTAAETPTATAAETPAARPSRTRRPRPSPSPTTEPPAPAETPTETRAPEPEPTTQAPEPTRTRRPEPTRTGRPEHIWPRRPQPTPTPTSQPEPTREIIAPPTRKAEPEPEKTQAPPPPAKAEEPRNPYSPQQVCNSGGHGSGFYVQRSASFDGGTVYQLYSDASGYNCVVAMKTANVGKASSIWAKLEVQGGGSSGDSGSFEYYAGPVMLSGKGHCVRYSGGSGSGSGGGDWANCG
ncbi:protein kinase domain-containing protein [Microtetraspora malaysiensis]|uniref:protein kinase domain-containing protein n=1 Tax=Microtetraspora malaysiensis TaxID=161358 RepID=UPI00083549A0|nr:serine/threonine-protein kinase [Microtetraspora malaysiensis]